MTFFDYIRIFLTFIMHDRIEGYEEVIAFYRETGGVLRSSYCDMTEELAITEVKLFEARARIVELEGKIKARNEKVEVLRERYHEAIILAFDCIEYLENGIVQMKDGIEDE